MDKNKFIETLNLKLDYLVETEKNKEIEKYKSVIDNYVNMGQSEVEAVSSLGSVDDLVSAIYLSHGLDYKKISTGKVTGKGLKIAFKNFYNAVTNKDKKVAGSALLYFLYLILLIILLKVVFIFIRDMGSQVFSDISVNSTVDKIYGIIFNVLYIASAILLFIKLFVKKFK